MTFDIRPARLSDLPFLAWVQQEAARSHLPSGFWDLAFPGPDADRLRLIERIARADARSFCHWTRFLVAEVDGQPAAALSGYERPSEATGTLLAAAFSEAFDAEGWDGAQRRGMGERVAPFMTCILEAPEDAWVLEWVATKPEHRGRGLIRALLDAVLTRGRERGHDLAQVCVLIGNTPAQRAYEGAGFQVADEKRDPDFERAIGSPGIRRLLRREPASR